MNRNCLMLVAGLSFVAVAPATIKAQTAPSPRSSIHPFVTFAFAPAIGQTGRNARGNHQADAHPVIDLSAGVRKQLVGKFGVVVSVNAGNTFDVLLGGSDLSCRSEIIDGKSTGCLPSDPLLDWFGVSAGAEGQFGPATVGMQVGPGSFGTRDYERDPATGEKSGRVLGVRSQLDVTLPLFRRIGITLSAVNRHVPKMLSDRMSVNSIGAGLTIR